MQTQTKSKNIRLQNNYQETQKKWLKEGEVYQQE